MFNCDDKLKQYDVGITEVTTNCLWTEFCLTRLEIKVHILEIKTGKSRTKGRDASKLQCYFTKSETSL